MEKKAAAFATRGVPWVPWVPWVRNAHEFPEAHGSSEATGLPEALGPRVPWVPDASFHLFESWESGMEYCLHSWTSIVFSPDFLDLVKQRRCGFETCEKRGNKSIFDQHLTRLFLRKSHNKSYKNKQIWVWAPVLLVPHEMRTPRCRWPLPATPWLGRHLRRLLRCRSRGHVWGAFLVFVRFDHVAIGLLGSPSCFMVSLWF